MEKRLNRREVLNELGYEDSIVFETPDYDKAIIGTTEDNRVVYSFEKMVECLMREDGMTYEESVEFIEFNTVRALPYFEGHPEIVYCTDVFDGCDDMDILSVNFDAKRETERVIQWIRNWFNENGKDCNAVLGVSGGKDSTIVAALCAKALGPDRVIGISMPDEGQGINDAEKICEHLGIKYVCIPIDGITGAMNFSLKLSEKDALSSQTVQNIPPRVRMTVLYGYAQSHNGRVANTCNLSEDYIGYSTLYGDSAGSFAPIANFTVTELKQIGRELGLPINWVDKIPDDGLPNSCPDEKKFGFSYETLDKFIREGVCNDKEIEKKIISMHKNSKFKRDIIKLPSFVF